MLKNSRALEAIKIYHKKTTPKRTHIIETQ